MKMNEQSQQDEERDNLSGSDDYEAWIASQEALPEHNRNGYAERINETIEFNEDR